MENHLIIHGHFYQPPREDPWTGLIPYQDSAHPYHDWNQRISSECYATNTKSRVLDSVGMITDVVNNFCNLSFNFGPTLLNWLKDHEPYVYRAIIQADKISRERNSGHGNAIAQNYNHTILPLASEQDARSQIIWGLKDFEAHFHREAEGIWLAETAINNNIVDLLIENKLKFVVLSPWQADAICPLDSSHWQNLNNNPVPTGRAYRIDRPVGSLNVFFYNNVLAQGISFEHYLRNADQLYEKFLSFRQSNDKTYMINVATDGEIYGHHEAFGDMCIAAFSQLVEKRNDFKFSNYGNYLEKYPPTYLVKLKGGEGNLGTSWSCVHGVSRWYKNCGCTTGGDGGWNQEWRTPVRNSFNFVNEKLLEIYQDKMQLLSSKDPFDIRNQYINVLTGQETREDFAARLIDKADHKYNQNINEFFSLLEGQKFCQFMFTSCGWFFSEISGLEATQNLKYAVKALDLYSRYDVHEIMASFMEILETARSNISSFGSGRNLVEAWIIPSKKSLEYGAAIFALKELCTDCWDKTNIHGIFRKHKLIVDEKNDGADFNDSRGKITVSDHTILKTSTFEYSFVRKDLQGIKLQLKNLDEAGSEIHEAPVTQLPIEIRKKITDLLSTGVVDKCISDIPKAFKVTRDTLKKIKDMNIKATDTILKLAELLIDRIFEQLFNDPTEIPSDDELSYIKELILFTQKNKLKVDINYLRDKISGLLRYQIEQLTENVLEEPSKGIIHLLNTCRSVNIEPEITYAQDIIFGLLKDGRNKSMLEIEASKDFSGLNRMRRLIKLGSQLGINVETYKEDFFNI